MSDNETHKGSVDNDSLKIFADTVCEILKENIDGDKDGNQSLEQRLWNMDMWNTNSAVLLIRLDSKNQYKEGFLSPCSVPLEDKINVCGTCNNKTCGKYPCGDSVMCPSGIRKIECSSCAVNTTKNDITEIQKLIEISKKIEEDIKNQTDGIEKLKIEEKSGEKAHQDASSKLDDSDSSTLSL